MAEKERVPVKLIEDESGEALTWYAGCRWWWRPAKR